MRLTMLSRAFFALLFAAAAGWESGKTCTTEDVRTLAKKDAKLSGTALADCVILDLRGETIAPEMLPRQVVVRTGHGIEDKEDTMIEPTTRMPLLTPAQLGELLGANSTISRVQLGWNFGMKEEGAETVARAIQLNGDTKLRHLEYHLNEMGDRGGVAFGQMLAANAQLTRLTLDANRIGGVGAAGLAQGLKTNAKLASLGLWKNPIGDDGAVALAEALRVNTALKSVALHACGITANGTAHLLDALMTNTALENLDLSGNKIGDAGALEVARWLQNHPQTKLASLELRGADITAAGAQAIADVVWPRPPPHLIDLDLRGNIISRGVSVGDHMGELPPPIQWDGPDGQYYQ